MVQITLPDGSQREFPGPVTVAEVAASIGAGLAKAALAGKVDGNIYAAERVEFHKDSVINGDISYGSIAIEHGARLLGMVVQNKAAAQSANRAQAAIESAQTKT